MNRHELCRALLGALTTGVVFLMSLPASGWAQAPLPGLAVRSGSVALRLEADRGAAANTVVSLGVPFAPGVLDDPGAVAVWSPAGAEIPTQATVLARWPKDRSIRSLLIAFRTSLSAGSNANYTLTYGSPRTRHEQGLEPNPDGPVVATLPARWYSASQVSGPQLATSDNVRFAQYDRTIETAIGTLDYAKFGPSCGSTNRHRTYYDGPHAMYQLFLRTGDSKLQRRAREEAQWYRDNELKWAVDGTLVSHKCQRDDWKPETAAMDWGVIRRLLSQGMLDDYLLTGDPKARAAVLGIGELYRRSLPLLSSGSPRSQMEATERNMAWVLMGLTGYVALDDRPAVVQAAASVADMAVAWQARGKTGGFEHDIVRPDPEECSTGPAGGSPFMASLLIDGLMDYHQLTSNPRVAQTIVKAAGWFKNHAVTSDGKAFRYLWNCQDRPYDDSGTVDLNLLIVHVFGAAYALSGDKQWLDFGDHIAQLGLRATYTRHPKQINQSARSFGKYLGYSAAALQR